jgi:hypothetical protein
MVAGIDRSYVDIAAHRTGQNVFKLIDDVGDIVFSMPRDNGKFSASGSLGI